MLPTRRTVSLMLAAVLLMHATIACPAGASEPTRAELIKQLDKQATDQVLASARSDDPFLRANAIEAMHVRPNRAMPLAQLGLEDDHPAVRFTALVTVGKLELEGLGEAALRLADDESASVRAAAIYAAHATGHPVDLSPLAQLLAAPNPGVRANVAMLLARMGERGAVPMLAEAARAPMRQTTGVQQALTRIQVAEAMASLGDTGAIEALRAGAYSQFDEVRVLAVQALGKMDDRQMEAALQHMLDLEGGRKPPIELRLAAAEALARWGDAGDAVFGTLREGADSDIAAVRTQAAMGLAELRDVRAIQELEKLLADDHEQVQLGAAAALLRAGAGRQRAGERR